MELVLDFRPTADRPAVQIERERLEQLVGCFQLFVGHELPNTLVPIQGFAKLLGEQADRLDDEGRMLLERLTALAQRADVWSRRLAATERLLRVPPAGGPVELAEIVREAAAEVNARLDGTVEVVISGVLPAVTACRPLLHAALVQLFSNAAQAGVAGPPAQVVVSARGDAGGTWLDVRDAGKGMKEGQLAWLLEPFASSRQPGAAGVGLGFFLVRQAVARWGGAVNVTTESGQGTTVSLFLPAERDARP